MGAFRLLLALRLRSLWNAARFAPPTHRRIGALLGAGAVLLFGAIFAVFLLLLGATRGAGDDVLRALIERTVFYLFLFLLAGAVPFVSSTLFASGDLPLLAAAPVRPGAVVAARLVDAVFASSAQFVVIGVPLLFASAAALRLDPWDWGLFLLLVALFLALPALLTAALLLLLARGIGVRRVRTAVAVASAVLAVAMCLLLVGEFSRQAGRATDGGLAGVLPRMASGGTTPGPPAWLPTAWASEALLALDARDPLAPLLPLSWLLLASALCAVVCVAAGRRVLLGESLLEGDEVSPTSAARADVLDRALALLPLSPPLRAMVGKDLRYLVRDLVLLSQVGIPVILYLVPFVIAGHLGGASSSFAEMFALSAGMVATIVYMETSILSLSSVGLEGRAFWLILAAPVSAGQFLRAKLAAALACCLLLCGPLLLFSGAVFRAPPLWTAVGMGVLVLACVALCGLGVGVAGIFPRFVYENPAHRASVSALVWGFVGATAYVVAVVAILAGGLFAAAQWPERATALVVGAVLLFGLLSVATALVPLLLACRRLENFAWEH